MLAQLSLETRYILYRICTNVTFYNVVWLYFYRIYINDSQIGLLDAMAFFIGLLFEIPSGAIADAIGRKKVVKFGQFLVVIGILLQVMFPEFWMFVFAQSILVIGLSFASGSDDALFYSAL
jgi:MFS family permease